MEKPTTNAPTRTGCLYSPNRREKLSEKGPEATLDPLFLAPKAAKQGYCEPFRRLLGFSWRPIGTFRPVSLGIAMNRGYGSPLPLPSKLDVSLVGTTQPLPQPHGCFRRSPTICAVASCQDSA